MFLCIGAALLFLIGLVTSVFWIWMLVSAIQNRGLGDSEKIAWVLLILFLHFLGALIYFLIGRQKRSI